VSGTPRHVLHVFSTFVAAGPETRTVRLIEAFGAAWRHSIVAVDGRTDAAAILPPDVDARVLESPPRAGSLATTRRLRRLVKELRPDLVCSYNWGAMDAVFATRTLGFAAHLHHEDGFNPDEVAGFVRRRVVARRIVLPGVARVIVPSRTLERIALETWRLPPARVACVPNGVRLERFPERDGNPALRAELGIPQGAPVVGFCGHLRAVKNPERFLKACARIDPELGAHVVVLGDGELRAELEELAARTASLFGRVHFVGHRPDPSPWYRAMDVFCMSSDSEQMPVAMVEAMASGLAVVSTDVGDVAAILPDEQARWVVTLGERESAWPLAEKLTELLRDLPRARELGRANRARATERFGFERMLAAYDELWRAAAGR
jgi:glycosyltransferase involved in cell wall biosynthesis